VGCYTIYLHTDSCFRRPASLSSWQKNLLSWRWTCRFIWWFGIYQTTCCHLPED